MHLKLNSGVAGKGIELQPGDVVDWQNDADCSRMIERGIATKATPEEIKSASGKVRTYCPPKATAADKWPPAPLKKLPKADSDAA